MKTKHFNFKHTIRRVFFLLCAILLLTGFQTTSVSAAAPKLSASKLTVNVKKTKALKLKNNKKKIKWSSSNKKVATVNKKGVVRGIKKGSCTITAKVGSKKYKCKVTVKQPVTKLTLNTKSIKLTRKNATKALKVTIKPSNASNKKIKWSSSDTSVASVNQKGIVRAKSSGTCVITALVDEKKVTCKVTVAIPGSTNASHVHSFTQQVGEPVTKSTKQLTQFTLGSIYNMGNSNNHLTPYMDVLSWMKQHVKEKYFVRHYHYDVDSNGATVNAIELIIDGTVDQNSINNKSDAIVDIFNEKRFPTGMVPCVAYAFVCPECGQEFAAQPIYDSKYGFEVRLSAHDTENVMEGEPCAMGNEHYKAYRSHCIAHGLTNSQILPYKYIIIYDNEYTYKCSCGATTKETKREVEFPNQ